MEVNQERNSWARYPKHMIKTDFSKWVLDKTLLLYTAIRYSSGLPDLYKVNSTGVVNSTLDNFKGARVQADLMIKYMLNSFKQGTNISFIAKNIFEDGNSIPAWSANMSNGIVGAQDRTYYLALEVPM
jgi:hypothetical protein